MRLIQNASARVAAVQIRNIERAIKMHQREIDRLRREKSLLTEEWAQGVLIEDTARPFAAIKGRSV